jgi:hypothetical protein
VGFGLQGASYLTPLALAVAAVACREAAGFRLGYPLTAPWAGFTAVVVDG